MLWLRFLSKKDRQVDGQPRPAAALHRTCFFCFGRSFYLLLQFIQ